MILLIINNTNYKEIFVKYFIIYGLLLLCIFGCAPQNTIIIENTGNSETIFIYNMDVTTILDGNNLNIGIKNPNGILYSLDLTRDSIKGKKHTSITENIYKGSVYRNLILYKLVYKPENNETISIIVTDVNKGVEIYSAPVLRTIK